MQFGRPAIGWQQGIEPATQRRGVPPGGHLEADAEAFRREEALRLPAGLDYAAIGGLSHEAREKLSAVRPVTLGQAARIEGVTPGAVAALLAHVRRAKAA